MRFFKEHANKKKASEQYPANKELSADEIVEKRIQEVISKAGNQFNVQEMALKIKSALGCKKAERILLGFNILNCHGEIVVATNKGYIFIPLPGELTSAGAAWSNYTWLILYYAQINLSSFLKELGDQLHTTVEDRCLYMEYLLHSPTFSHPEHEEVIHPQDEVAKKFNEFCDSKHNDFLITYKKQIAQKSLFDSYREYYNYGFSYRYIPAEEIKKTINTIYQQKEVLKENGYWENAKAVIENLHQMADTI